MKPKIQLDTPIYNMIALQVKANHTYENEDFIKCLSDEIADFAEFCTKLKDRIKISLVSIEWSNLVGVFADKYLFSISGRINLKLLSEDLGIDYHSFMRKHAKESNIFLLYKMYKKNMMRI